MSSFREGETLSKRLQLIHSHYSGQKHIWDIGCDHGLLGLSFQGYPEVESLHFVDPSGPVIDKLKTKLKDSYITKKPFFIHHQEGQSLIIESHSNCIFIAGMGGKEIEGIIQGLLPQLDESSQFVISPHRKILELRQSLSSLPVVLLKEELILEDGQFYQVISLKKGTGARVSLYGEAIWEGETGEKYREHQLNYLSLHRDVASQEYSNWLNRYKLLKSIPK